MQKQQDVISSIEVKGQKPSHISRHTFFILLAIIGSSVLLYSSYTAIRQRQDSPTPSLTASKTIASNGADLWQHDTQVKPASFDFSPPASQTLNVDPLFARYYQSASGAQSLGTPLTVAFPISQGWIQFFTGGALLSPTTQTGNPQNASKPLTPLTPLINTGIRSSSSGIIRLPLLQALLTAGSKAAIDGAGSSLTYIDLRKATNPALMQPAPAHPAPASPVAKSAVFVKGGTRSGQDAGYLIPPSIWNYINRGDISPDGWKTDFGAPLTGAIPFTLTENGSTHHLLVQAFWRDGVVLDQSALDASGQPQIQRLDTSLAYLRTLGPPTVTVTAQQTMWTQSNIAPLNAAGTGQAVAHIGQNFSLTPLGDANWQEGMLWYHVQWSVPEQTHSGWVPANAITFTSPGNAPAMASFDALSPALAAYLASIGDDVDAVVYDITHQRYYTYNASSQFIMGSSMKVAIMVTFFDMIERQGREPTNREIELLTTMIENSNNDSASALYYGEIGGASGVASYLQGIGIIGLNPYPTAWGYSVVTPMTMVHLLTRLYQGTILTAHHRDLAFYWMEHIESDQQVGVGDTAPNGVTVAMKDGWLPGPDGAWAMNSSGIVMSARENYIISVYTHEQNSLADGQAIARHVCSTVATLLI